MSTHGGECHAAHNARTLPMAGAQFKQNHPKFVKPTHDSPYISDRPSSVGLGDTNGGRIKESIPHAAGEPEIGQAGIGFGDQARGVSSPTPPPAPAVVGLRPGSDRAKRRVRAVRVCRSLDDEGLSNIYGA